MTNSVTRDFQTKDPGNRFKGKLVLVVEDNPVIQLITKALLEKYGCIVEIAHDGERALDKIASKKFDLIFMDYYLSKLSGLEITSEIRNTANKNKETPIVAFTGEEDEAVVSESFKGNGMDDYIMKPIDEISMLKAMKRLFDNAATR